MNEVQDGILGALDFGVGDGMLGHIVNLLIQRLDGFERAGALRSHGQAHDARMIEGGSNAAADGVGQSLLGADGAEQA